MTERVNITLTWPKLATGLGMLLVLALVGAQYISHSVGSRLDQYIGTAGQRFTGKDQEDTAIRAELAGAIAGLRAEIAGLRKDIGDELGGVRTELTRSSEALGDRIVKANADIQTALFARMDVSDKRIGDRINLLEKRLQDAVRKRINFRMRYAPGQEAPLLVEGMKTGGPSPVKVRLYERSDRPVVVIEKGEASKLNAILGGGILTIDPSKKYK